MLVLGLLLLLALLQLLLLLLLLPALLLLLLLPLQATLRAPRPLSAGQQASQPPCQ